MDIRYSSRAESQGFHVENMFRMCHLWIVYWTHVSSHHKLSPCVVSSVKAIFIPNCLENINHPASRITEQVMISSHRGMPQLYNRIIASRLTHMCRCCDAGRSFKLSLNHRKRQIRCLVLFYHHHPQHSKCIKSPDWSGWRFLGGFTVGVWLVLLSLDASQARINDYSPLG